MTRAIPPPAAHIHRGRGQRVGNDRRRTRSRRKLTRPRVRPSRANASGERVGIVGAAIDVAAAINVDAVELPFPGTGSGLAAVTVAVLLIWPVANGATLSTMLNVAEAPLANVAMVHVIVPVPPTTGFVQANTGPVVWFSETKVVLGGSVSVIKTVAASEGPLFVTTTV